MRVGFRTLFPASPLENDRWTVQVVSLRTLLRIRILDWVWPYGLITILGAAALTVRALNRGGPGKLVWLVVAVVTFAPVLVVLQRRRKARIRGVEHDSRRHIASGTARARAIDMLQASPHVRKSKAAPEPLIGVLLFLGRGGAIEVWVDAPGVGMVEIGLPANVTGLVLCTRRGRVAGVAFADRSGRTERLRLGTGRIADSPSAIAEFEANLARVSIENAS